MGNSRQCAQCAKALDDDNTTRVCSEDCFYEHIYWGTPEEPGVLVKQ